MPAADRLEGPLVLGVGWKISEHLVRTAAALAAALGQHLVCAFVDPASYLTEWEPDGTRTALSLDPVINEEADFPSADLLHGLTEILGEPGEAWSFRVLNGDVAKALCRLAESTGASVLVVGAGQPGPSGWVDRLLQGSVWGNLTDGGRWPVLVVPEAA
jgi:nucleotide-binding universal stress UspA family protein